MWQMSLPFGRPKKPRRPVVKDERDGPRVAPPRRKLIPDLRPDWMKEPASGPGPSRIVYRLRRAWAKGWVRRTVRMAVPLGLLGLVVWQGAQDQRLRAAISSEAEALMASLSQRPEFAVRGIAVAGATPELELLVREAIVLPAEASSLNVDLGRVKTSVEAIGAVASADVVLDPQGTLRVHVRERIAELLWRDAGDRLWLVDREGVAIAVAVTRAGYPDLPLLLGEGGTAAAAEALDLYQTAPDIMRRLRAFVRVGERRWDLVLDRDLRILLPELAPAEALSHIAALHYGEEILDRDLVAIDMRQPARPTFRLSPAGIEALRLRDAAIAEGEDT